MLHEDANDEPLFDFDNANQFTLEIYEPHLVSQKINIGKAFKTEFTIGEKPGVDPIWEQINEDEEYLQDILLMFDQCFGAENWEPVTPAMLGTGKIHLMTWVRKPLLWQGIEKLEKEIADKGLSEWIDVFTESPGFHRLNAKPPGMD